MSTLTRPINVQLEITDRCNLRCKHCYHLDFSQEQANKDLEYNQVMKIAEKLVESGIFSIVLTGGEPLLRKELVLKLVQYFKAHDIEVMLNTNLLAMDKKTLDQLMKYKLDGMLVSCTSTNPSTYKLMTGGGDYQKFETKLAALISTGFRFSVNMVVNKRNLKQIWETAKKLQSLGVKSFGATPMGLSLQCPDIENFLSKNEVSYVIEELISINQKLGLKIDIFETIPQCAFSQNVRLGDWAFLQRNCQAGKTTASIGNSGEVRSCSHATQSYGNILFEDLQSIWARMTDWRDDTKIPLKCKDCSLLFKCFGGCRVVAETCTGDCKGHDPWMSNPISKEDSLHHRKCEKISLTPEMVVTAQKTFRWRKEGEEEILVFPDRGSGGMIMINSEYFEFLTRLKEKSAITLSLLAQEFGISFDNVDYQRVIKELIEKKFLRLG